MSVFACGRVCLHVCLYVCVYSVCVYAYVYTHGVCMNALSPPRAVSHIRISGGPRLIGKDIQSGEGGSGEGPPRQDLRQAYILLAMG